MSYKAGFIGLIGQPNSGKSSLVNVLVGEKVSIVSSKPQTTRRRMVGVYTDDAKQILFVDAPGVVKPNSGLNKFLDEESRDVIQNSDALMAVLNIDEKTEEGIDKVIELVSSAKKPWIAVISKTDLPQVHRVEKIRAKLAAQGVPVLAVSATSRPEECRETLLAALTNLIPEAPGPLYETEIVSLASLREISEELIREQAFEQLHQEIPFGLAVRINRFVENEGPLIKIYADLLVAKENHRPIVIGRGGAMLKTIGSSARISLEKFLDRKVYLDLHVSVKKNWSKNPAMMKELGYVLPAHA